MAAFTFSLPEPPPMSPFELKPEASAHGRILQQLIAKTAEHQSMNADVLARINQWEHSMIDRIRQKAERAREQLSRLRGSDEREVIEDAKKLIDEICIKIDAEKLLVKADLERLEQNIDQLTQALARATKQDDLQLCIEPSHMIDWNHLIYVQDKSIVREAAVSSRKDSGVISNSPLVAERIDASTQTEKAFPMMFTSSRMVLTPTTSISGIQNLPTVNRGRRPTLPIVPPVSIRPVDVPQSNPLPYGTNKAIQAEFPKTATQLFASALSPPTDNI